MPDIEDTAGQGGHGCSTWRYDRERYTFTCTECGHESERDEPTGEWEYDYEEWPRCSCPWCHCLNETEYGEVCNACQRGSHQG
ncbi:MAG: hypothetical protein K8L99_31320 [Anaerolineae bacterium]|nr:hypothetical protein [Anaerolineae bacterium]